VTEGKSPAAVSAAIRKAVSDEVLAADYIKDVEALRGENAKMQEYEAQVATTQRELSPVEKMFRDAGLPLPTEQYTSSNVSGDNYQVPQSRDLDKLRSELVSRQATPDRLASEYERQAAPRPAASPRAQAGVNPYAPKDMSNWERLAQAGYDGDILGAGKAIGSWASGMFDGDTRSPMIRSIQDGAPKAEPEAAKRSWGSTGPKKGRTDRRGTLALQNEIARREGVAANDDAEYRTMKAHAMQQSGRTPTGDAIMARQMLARMMGMST
jgi:hypothetical protein